MKTGEKNDAFEYKAITIGDSSVGKTSIIKRYMYNTFNKEILSTTGINYCIKDVFLKNNEKLRLKIFDTAGQEKYKSISKNYFRNTDVILFVFDLNNEDSFDNISSWINLFNECNTKNLNIPKYLLGNKSDLEKEVPQEKIDTFLSKNNNFIYKEISAKEENDNIKNLFQEIGERLYEENKNIHRSSSKIKLIDNQKEKKKCMLSGCIV